jgi:hypothetical protein
MNKKIILLLPLVALSVAAGAVAVASSAQASKEAVKADSTETFTLSVALNSSITPTALKAHVFNGTNPYKGWDDDETMVAGASLTIGTVAYRTYSYTFPQTFLVSGVETPAISIVFRVDSYQTNDLSVPDFVTKSTAGHVFHYVINEDVLPPSTATRLTGDWQATSSPAFSSSSMRLWLDRQGNYESGNLWSYHYWNAANTIDKEVVPNGYVDFSATSTGRYLVYYDIPVEAVGCYRQFKAYSSSTGAFQASTAADGEGSAYKSYAAGDNAELYYITSASSSFNLSKGCAAQNAASQSLKAAALANVFYGYFTCSNDLNNGYGNWATFTSTWIHNSDATPVWWVSGDLASVTYADCALESDYASGTRGSATVDLYSKFLRMEALYTSAHGSGVHLFAGDKENSPLLYSLLGASVALGGVVAFFFLKKRRDLATKD